MARHQPTEELLARHRVDFVFLPRQELTRFDMQACQVNQARHVWKHDPTVEKYRRMYETNPDPPAVVAYEVDGKLISIDGNHRILGVGAAEGTCIDVYLVKTLDYTVIQKLTWIFNIWLDGLAADEGMALQHAIHSVRWLHMSHKEASDQFCQPINAILRGIEQAKIQERFSERKQIRDGIPVDSQRSLNGLDNDNTFDRAVKVQRDNKLQVDETREMVRSAQAARTEEGQAEAINKWVDAHPSIIDRQPHGMGVNITNPAPPKPLPKTYWLRDFHKVVDLLEKNPTCEKMGLTGPNEFAEVQGLVARFDKRLPGLLQSWGKASATK